MVISPSRAGAAARDTAVGMGGGVALESGERGGSRAAVAQALGDGVGGRGPPCCRGAGLSGGPGAAGGWITRRGY
eukprot:COSAG06_NODE_8638_length_2108_cov_2.492285_1_plen_74_part_10